MTAHSIPFKVLLKFLQDYDPEGTFGNASDSDVVESVLLAVNVLTSAERCRRYILDGSALGKIVDAMHSHPTLYTYEHGFGIFVALAKEKDAADVCELTTVLQKEPIDYCLSCFLGGLTFDFARFHPYSLQREKLRAAGVPELVQQGIEAHKTRNQLQSMGYHILSLLSESMVGSWTNWTWSLVASALGGSSGSGRSTPLGSARASVSSVDQ